VARAVPTFWPFMTKNFPHCNHHNSGAKKGFHDCGITFWGEDTSSLCVDPVRNLFSSNLLFAFRSFYCYGGATILASTMVLFIEMFFSSELNGSVFSKKSPN